MPKKVSRFVQPRMATEIDKKAGELLCALRRAKKMTQSDVAKETGLSIQQIQKYEKGKNRISISRLFAILDMLDKDVVEFIKELKSLV